MTNPAPDLHLVQSHPEPVDPLIGITLDGRYSVERVLGKGGMGLVYAAKHVVLQKRLAIKVLKEEVSRDEQVMARFRREAQSASAIGSQHICDVSDFGSLPDGSTYFVMEFLDGPSLTAAMEAQRPMPIDRILSVGMQLCDALGAAHERGIVHRDLKPDNVHLVHQGNHDHFVKVLDFGIAKVGDGGNMKLTQAGQVFGTPHYMSPEQCSGREVDHRTDIYALGVMLYEMCTGQVPFDADNLMGVLTKHVYENPIPPREFPPPVEVPAGLEAIVLKSLAKQPEARYQTMQELKSDLDKVAKGGTPDAVMQALGGTSVPRTQMISSAHLPGLSMSPETPSMIEEPKKSRVGLVVGGLLAVLLLGGGAFAAAFFLGSEPVETTPVAGNTEIATETETTATTETETEVVAVAEDTQPEVVVPPPVVMVSITTEPEGAEVYTADGTLIGNAPMEIQRPEGSARTEVTIRAPGFEDRTVTVSGMTRGAVNVRLDRVVVRSTRHRVRQPPPTVTTPPTSRSLPPPPPPVRSTHGGTGSEIISPW